MDTQEYISNDVKALTLGNTVKEAKELFDQLTFTHIPVVENDRLLGSISESDIRTIENDKGALKDYCYLLDTFFAEESDNWVTLIRIFAVNESNTIPILNEEKNYIGYYELSDILHLFSDTPFLNEEGFMLVVEKGFKDYSLSEVSQIVESNKGKILGIFVSNVENDMVRITLKINSQEINEIIQTFRRYNFNVLTEHHDDYYLEDLKNRSDYLKKYLNV